MNDRPRNRNKFVLLAGLIVLGVAFACFFLLPDDDVEQEKEVHQESAAIPKLTEEQAAFDKDLKSVETIASDLTHSPEAIGLNASLASLRETLASADDSFVYHATVRAEVEALLNEALQLRRSESTPQPNGESNARASANALQRAAASLRERRRQTTEERISQESRAVSEQTTAESNGRITRLKDQASELESSLVEQLALEKKQLLEFEFQKDLTQIQSLLRPFLAPGAKFTTPDGKPSIKGAQPTSLGYLRKRGYLKEDVESMERFMQAATNRRLDMGAFPAARGGFQNCDLETVNTVRRAHALMLKYGELLVEKGMLSP